MDNDNNDNNNVNDVNDIFKNRCYGIIKNSEHTRCKSINRHNSIFCSIHKRYKPKYVAVILDSSINNNNVWSKIPFTNEIDAKIEIQNIKDKIEKDKLDKIIKEIERFNSITT